MTDSSRRIPARWVDGVSRRPIVVLLVVLLLTVASGWYSVTHFAIDTDPGEMLSRELPFRQTGLRHKQAFPMYPNSIVVVVDGPNADLVDHGARELVERIEARPDLFESVFHPQGMEFFQRNGLLYLDVDEVADLIDRLAEAQPLLGILWQDPNLPGLFDVLRQAVEESREGDAPLEVDFVFERVASVVEAQTADRTGYLSWQELMRGRELEPHERRQLVVLQPIMDYGSIEPAGAALDGLRELERDLGLAQRYGVRVRVTGPTALETEELRSVQQGMGVATVLSLSLVLLLLVVGLRSKRVVLATLLTLVVGLIWSLGFAFSTVGRLNLVSVAFAVLFVGLSVDFGIHFALRFREEIDAGRETGPALGNAAAGVGRSLGLSALAAAIGFYSFLPTDYVGLAELGWIAGSSMFVALVANLTVLPALLAVMPHRRHERRTVERRAIGRTLVRSRPRSIVVGGVVLGLISAVLASWVRFDFDPLNLRDPESESVRTLFELAEDATTTPYRIVVLTDGLTSAREVAERVQELAEVDATTTLASFVPKDQEEKLELIYTGALFLLPALEGEPEIVPPDAERRRRSLREFRRELDHLIRTAEDEAEAERRLAQGLDALEAQKGLGEDVLAELEQRLVATLAGRLETLRVSLDADVVTLDDLPESVRRRWLSPGGTSRVEITAATRLVRDDQALREFVEAVQRVTPDFTGMPVEVVESGKAVVRAFITATLLSLVLVAGVVGLLLRRLRDVLLILVPLTLAALLTVASTVVLGLPFNFANVIVLPLLFGLGVASGIHLVMRARDETGPANVLDTSTPRAVLFSSLTTMGSFGSLALSQHPGTSSMGVLLTVSIALTLVCMLGVLPALMEVFPDRKSR